MITEKKLPPSPRATTSSEEDKRDDRLDELLRKVEDAVSPVLVSEMTAVASELMRLGIMQMFENKAAALRFLDATYLRIAEMIDAGFHEYKRESKRGIH